MRRRRNPRNPNKPIPKPSSAHVDGSGTGEIAMKVGFFKLESDEKVETVPLESIFKIVLFARFAT